MLGFNRWHLLKGLAAIFCIAGIVWLALSYFMPAPPSAITIAGSFKGGHYESLALRYKDILARAHVDVNVRTTDGAVENLKLLNDPKSGVKVAVIQGGVSNSNEMPGLLSLGRINYQVFWIFYHGTETMADAYQTASSREAPG